MIPHYNSLRDQINAQHQARLAACEALSGQAKQDCIAAAIADHAALSNEALTAMQEAIDDDLDAAIARKKTITDSLTKEGWRPLTEILELKIPGPQQIQQGPTSPLLANSFATTSSIIIGGGGGGPTMIEKTWATTGSFSFEDMGETFTATLSGSIDVTIDPPGGGSVRRGTVKSGTIVLDYPGGITATLTVDPGNGEFVRVFANGTGLLDFVVDIEYSDLMWGAASPSKMWVRAPITLTSGDDVLNIDLISVDPSTLYPYQPRPYTDYDQDGNYDLSLDSIAFLAGFNAQTRFADINLDGIWDVEDTDLWFLHFNEDVANSQ